MIRMPTCAARRVLAALTIAVSMGCGTTVDDVFIPEDSGKDTTTKDVTTDTSILDASKDTSLADTSVVDTSVADAIADADTDADDGSSTDGGSPEGSVMDGGSPDGSVMDGGGPDGSVMDGGGSCGQALGFGYASSDGGCGTGESYSCSLNKYELVCECPAQTCTCKKNGVQVNVIKFAGCPGCKQPNFATVASNCGVPH